MFMNLSFDELNALVTNERSVPFEQYFGEMNIPEEDKAERIHMAEDLENNFIATIADGINGLVIALKARKKNA